MNCKSNRNIKGIKDFKCDEELKTNDLVGKEFKRKSG